MVSIICAKIRVPLKKSLLRDRLPGMFRYFKERRRKRIVESSPIPGPLWEDAAAALHCLRGLRDEELSRLRGIAAIFLAEKEFLPVRGATVTEDIKIAIAALAGLPVLNLGIDRYDGWSSIILTPREYLVENREVDNSGVVREYEDEVSGEVLELGPVVFSLADILDFGGGYNVVIHEMAHKIDGRSGAVDGMPPLDGRVEPERWRKDFGAAFEHLRGVGGPRRKSPLLKRFDSYAAEDPAEFFAVSCEYFFERPHFLSSLFPEVYARLSEFFLQDPASRTGGR
jgi:hypothetical protein